METIKIENDVMEMAITAMEKSEMLGSLSRDMLGRIASRALLVKFDAREMILTEEEPSDCFFMIVQGEVAVLSKVEGETDPMELGHITPPAVLGEIGLLLQHNRTAGVRAVTETMLLKFDRSIFDYMFEHIPAFGHTVSKFLANRVHQLSAQVALPQGDDEAKTPPPRNLLKMFPIEFLIRHRVLPMRTMDNILFMGCVDDPTPALINAVHRQVPGQEVRLIRIKSTTFNNVIENFGGVEGWQTGDKEDKKEAAPPAVSQSPRLDALLKRLITEGASDLHLPAGQLPYWRIDGDIKPIGDAKKIEKEEVFQLLEPVMNERAVNEFREMMDVDFAYSMPGGGRFRVNMYKDSFGVSAAFRAIPSTIFTLDQLRMPPVVEKMLELSEGLILVTGPSGSGKSTTLASMIHHINQRRRTHIVTLEDPIEFIHTSDKSLVTQRELGNHVTDFARGLRAALREDPDIVLLGEMRDLETMALALEMADTGHLVFATLHTSTAVGTVNRIIDMYSAEQQNQIRQALGDSLKAVISQTLCKRSGGGRVAAFEILRTNNAIGNMIREAKTIQIPSMMQTLRAEGNSFLNEDLYKLVNTKKISAEEAIDKALDKAELEERLGALAPAPRGAK